MAKRRKGRKRGKKSLGAVLAVALIVVISMFWNGSFSQLIAERNYEKTGNEEELQVHFIDVDQGDATLILQGEHAMLIDAGENEYGNQIVDYLNYLGVDHLDYVIGTHPDSDHIGGLDTVLENISWDTVLMPDYEKDTRTYEDVVEVLYSEGKEPVSPKPGDVYSLGTAQFTVLAPIGTYDSGNENSIALRLVHGGSSFLFTGDAESGSESDMLLSGRLLASDVYKVAHHGSSGANTELFLLAVNPEYAVISCGKDNEYGHPHSEVLNRLRAMGTKVFRTDEQGTIVATSDGSEVTFQMSPSETWQSGR